MDRAFEKEFAQWSHRVHPLTTNAPSSILIYSGMRSQVLAKERATVTASITGLGSPLVRARFLARTEAGQYFTLTHELTLEDLQSLTWRFEPCDKVSCRRMVDFRELTPEQAKAWLIQSKSFSAPLYERLFGEAPPAKEVEP